MYKFLQKTVNRFMMFHVPLEQAEPVEGPEDDISHSEIETAVKQMRNNKGIGTIPNYSRDDQSSI